LEEKAMNTAVSTTPDRGADVLTRPAVSEQAAAFAGNARTALIALKATFSVVPIVAGLDKFTNLLTHWENYLNPALAHLLPFSPRVFMGAVGVIEIAAGFIVFFRPRIGALIVAAWLAGIALSLIVSGQYLDVAVRDLVMAVAAFSLANLAPDRHSSPQSQREPL
jgi:hypothetical protein